MKLWAVLILAFLFIQSCSIEDSNNQKSDVLFNHLNQMIDLGEQDTNYLIIITRNGCQGCFQSKMDSLMNLENEKIKFITSNFNIVQKWNEKKAKNLVLDSSGIIDKLQSLHPLSFVITDRSKIISIEKIN